METSPASTEGQVATAPEGTTQASPTEPTGQAISPTTTQEPESFFDPTSLDPALQPAYKQMQGAFTKKMQEISKARKETEALTGMQREYQADPYGFVNRLAQQHGWSVQQAAAQAAQAEQKPWQPQTWEEVLERAVSTAKDATRAEVMKEFQPVVEQVRSNQARMIESQLDEIDPMWRTYETQMSELAGMVRPEFWKRGDAVLKLYEMSLPANVREARAAQAVKKKMQAASSAAAPQGASQKPKASPAPNGVIKSFADSVAAAKRELFGG